jgi:hypothetical protein
MRFESVSSMEIELEAAAAGATTGAAAAGATTGAAASIAADNAISKKNRQTQL